MGSFLQPWGLLHGSGFWGGEAGLHQRITPDYYMDLGGTGEGQVLPDSIGTPLLPPSLTEPTIPPADHKQESCTGVCIGRGAPGGTSWVSHAPCTNCGGTGDGSCRTPGCTARPQRSSRPPYSPPSRPSALAVEGLPIKDAGTSSDRSDCARRPCGAREPCPVSVSREGWLGEGARAATYVPLMTVPHNTGALPTVCLFLGMWLRRRGEWQLQGGGGRAASAAPSPPKAG